MRGLSSLAGLLVVALIAALTYRFYFTKSGILTSSSTPAQTIDVVGVKGDLLAIGQAERRDFSPQSLARGR